MATVSVAAQASRHFNNWEVGQPYQIILFYRYVLIVDVEALILKLKTICTASGILGRILVAAEGVNGTLAGSVTSIAHFIHTMTVDERFSNVDWKLSQIDAGASSLPFLCLSVRETKEIISTGRSKAFISKNTAFDENSFGGLSGTGQHLAPVDFHEVPTAAILVNALIESIGSTCYSRQFLFILWFV